MQRFLNDKVTLHAGDCLDVIKTIADASIDSVVTDPPYALVSIGKRYGSADAVPAKGAVYARASAGFMGKTWDTGEVAFSEAFWREVLRVLKPGGHVIAASGTRTYHRLACAIEDAGFEIRDMVSWLYGSGFPKSHDVSKGIDKAAGAERTERMRPKAGHESFVGKDNLKGLRDGTVGTGEGGYARPWMTDPQKVENSHWDFAPATDAARQWAGWGTALKPCHEPWVLARKPLQGKTVAANVLEFGTGAINVDACRVQPDGDKWEHEPRPYASSAADAGEKTKPATRATEEFSATKPAVRTLSGRAEKPQPDTSRTDIGCSDGTRAEATCTSSSIGAFGNKQTALSPSGTTSTISTRIEGTTDSKTSNASRGSNTDSDTSCTTQGKNVSQPMQNAREPIARASEQPRGRFPGNLIHDGSDEVVGAFPETKSGLLATHHQMRESENTSMSGKNYTRRPKHDSFGDEGSASRFFYSAKADADDRLGSKHPTVKPVDLMQYLCRLITPPGGTVLDPFAGTGTTGEAAWREGFSAVLIEREAEYRADIERRMKLALGGPDERRPAIIKEKSKGKPVDHGPLFGGLEAAE